MRRAIMIVTALTGVLLMTVLILTCILPLDYQGSALDSITEMSGGWIYADGTPADPMGIRFDNKESTITHTINGDTINGRELCFISRNVNFTVCLDDTVIYDFHPHLTGLYGEFYGDHRHTIQLPSLRTNGRALTDSFYRIRGAISVPSSRTVRQNSSSVWQHSFWG